MLDVAPTELLLVALVALIVIGPKDLPKAMRFVGYWIGRARGVARQFRSGFDTMVREAELQDMEKRWAEENARIMAEHTPIPAPQMVPLPAPEAALEGKTGEHKTGEHKTGGDEMGGDESAAATVEMPVVAPQAAPHDATPNGARS